MKISSTGYRAKSGHWWGVRIVCLAIGLGAAGCGESDEAAGPTPETPLPVGSLVTALPLSATEADRLVTIIAAPGGKYVAVGSVTRSGDNHMALARLTPTGALDPTFGQNGLATVNVAVGGKTAELARGAVVQSNGKIVICGPVEHDPTAPGDAARDTDVVLVRFDANGQLDQSFGTNGMTRLDFGAGVATSATAFRGDTAWGLTLLPNDELLVVGGKKADGNGRTDIDYVVAKLDAGGVIDPGFGVGGLVTLDIGNGNDNPRTAVVQPDGNIVVSGHTSGANGVITTVLFRLLPTGQFDSTFGQQGVVNHALLPSVAEAYDVALQGNHLVIAGYGRMNPTDTVDIIAARFLPNGAVDPTFGTNGVTMIDVAGQDDRSRKLEILPDQRILIVGQGKPLATRQDGALVLLTANGQRDARFNGNGVALFHLGGATDALFGVVTTPDRSKAVAVGWKGLEAAAASSADNEDARVVIMPLPSTN